MRKLVAALLSCSTRVWLQISAYTPRLCFSGVAMIVVFQQGEAARAGSWYVLDLEVSPSTVPAVHLQGVAVSASVFGPTSAMKEASAGEGRESSKARRGRASQKRAATFGTCA